MKTFETTTLADFFAMSQEELYKLKRDSQEYVSLINQNINSHPEEYENNAIRYREVAKYEAFLIMVHMRLITLSTQATTAKTT